MNYYLQPSQTIDSSSCGNQALSLMHQYAVAPIPDNYAIWFHYVLGKNTLLVDEVNNIIKNSLKFSEETCSYLHNKFIVPGANQKNR